MINCEVELILNWSKSCVLIDMTVRVAGNNNDPPAIVTTNGFEFQTQNCTCPLLLCQKKNYKNLVKLKSGFKRTVKWNKYRSKMTVESNDNNLNYSFDPTFSTDYLFCHLKELKKTMLKRFIEILFHVIM